MSGPYLYNLPFPSLIKASSCHSGTTFQFCFSLMLKWSMLLLVLTLYSAKPQGSLKTVLRLLHIQHSGKKEKNVNLSCICVSITYEGREGGREGWGEGRER